jgi:neurotransmitter:Na+ symporter, NSS family
VVVAFLVEELNIKRSMATLMATLAALFVGVFCTLSFGALKDVTIGSMSIFGILDFTASNVLLPLGGFFIVIFVGWYMSKADVKDELSNGGIAKN